MKIILGSFLKDVQDLKSSKWRSSATHSKAEQIEGFKIEDMVCTMKEHENRN